MILDFLILTKGTNKIVLAQYELTTSKLNLSDYGIFTNSSMTIFPESEKNRGIIIIIPTDFKEVTLKLKSEKINKIIKILKKLETQSYYNIIIDYSKGVTNP